MLPIALSQVGLPFAAALHGCGLVLPGHDLTPAGLCEVIAAERPTIGVGFGGALPGILDHWRRERTDLSSLRGLVCGGFAVPRALSRAFEEEVGVPIMQVFGMTETSGHGCFTHLPDEALADPSEETRRYYLTTQGRPLPLVDTRLRDDARAGVPWDGASIGEFQVRGPWIAREYFRAGASDDHFADGWLRTGDAATIDRLGYVRILDRMRDLVRSSDGWISSLQLEEHLLAHPAVAQAAVVAVPDGESGERPLACVVSRAESRDTVRGDELIEFLRSRVPAAWLPREVVFADELPKTSVGKTDKAALRARHGGAAASDPSHSTRSDLRR
jgi:fatty-acyl-CoA synthase